MNHEYSCGAVVFTRLDGEIRYVIMQSCEGVYGFPKGHMEPGETEQQTALREIYEEVGLHVRLLPDFRFTTDYPIVKKPGTMKHVTFFLAEYEDQPLRPQPEEVKSVALMTFSEAMAVLPYERLTELLTQANDFLNA